jgi:hypothetical protein
MAFLELCSAVNSNRMGICLSVGVTTSCRRQVLKLRDKSPATVRVDVLNSHETTRSLTLVDKVIRPISYRSYIANHSLNTSKAHTLRSIPYGGFKDANHRQVSAEPMNGHARNRNAVETLVDYDSG